MSRAHSPSTGRLVTRTGLGCSAGGQPASRLTRSADGGARNAGVPAGVRAGSAAGRDPWFGYLTDRCLFCPPLFPTSRKGQLPNKACSVKAAATAVGCSPQRFSSLYAHDGGTPTDVNAGVPEVIPFPQGGHGQAMAARNHMQLGDPRRLLETFKALAAERHHLLNYRSLVLLPACTGVAARKAECATFQALGWDGDMRPRSARPRCMGPLPRPPQRRRTRPALGGPVPCGLATSESHRRVT